MYFEADMIVPCVISITFLSLGACDTFDVLIVLSLTYDTG